MIFCPLLSAISFLSSVAVAKAVPWAENLWLGREGVWTRRVSVSFENNTSFDWAPTTGVVNLGAPPGKDFRVADEQGVELCWNYDQARNALLLPVRCAAGERRTLYCYSGNASAWELSEHWEGMPSNGAPVGVVGKVERLELREVRASDAWPKDKWLWRVPLTIVNASDRDRPSAIVSFPLFQVRRECAAPELMVEVPGSRQQVCVLGGSCIILVDLPAKTLIRAYCYVRDGVKKDATEIRYSKASAIGNDFAFADDAVSGKSVELYERLLGSAANLLRNPSFELVNKGKTKHPAQVWNPTGRMSECRYGVEDGSARFGNRAIYVDVPGDVRDDYRGWSQKVVAGDFTRGFIFGCAVKGRDLAAPTGMDLHVRAGDGKVLSYVGSQNRICGSEDWTLVFGSVPPLPAARDVVVKLTTKKSGRAVWDGVLFAQTQTALAGDRERPADAYAKSDFAAAQVDSLIKVFRDTPVPSRDDCRLGLARGETETLQIAVRSKKGLASLCPAVVPPVNEDGECLSVKAWSVEEVMIDYPSAFHHFYGRPEELKRPTGNANSDGWTGWWPDPMLPVSPHCLEANRTRSYRFQIRASASAKAGDYRGEIVWREGERILCREPLAVRVWNFSVPERPTFPAIYDLAFGKPWNERGWKDRRHFNEFMFAAYAEYKICPHQPHHYCAPAPDAAYDRACELFFDKWKFPVAYCSSQFTCLFCWAHPPKAFRGTPAYLDASADRLRLNPEYKRKFQEEFRRYWNHMREKGWADRMIFYVADEPAYQEEQIIRQFSALCDLVHEVDPKIRTYSSTWFPQPRWEDGRLDIWGAGNFGRFPETDMKRVKSKGGTIWFTTDGQIVIDTPYALTERSLAWYSYFYGAEAYEYWRSNYQSLDHWKFGWHRYGVHSGRPGEQYYQRYPNGDGYLFYPPKGDGDIRELMPSIRLEAARDGVEDHSYLMALEKLAAGADNATARKAREILSQWRDLCSLENRGGHFTSRDLPDPAEPSRLRWAAGELLSSSGAR